MESQAEITVLLDRLRMGEGEVASELLPLLYPNLRGLAGAMFRRQDAARTLQPTALVHEASRTG